MTTAQRYQALTILAHQAARIDRIVRTLADRDDLTLRRCMDLVRIRSRIYNEAAHLLMQPGRLGTMDVGGALAQIGAGKSPEVIFSAKGTPEVAPLPAYTLTVPSRVARKILNRQKAQNQGGANDELG